MSTSLPKGLARAVERRLLACPHCGEILAAHARSLVCPRGHCHDVARQGHVHLAEGKKPPQGYDRALMEARAAVAAQNFFAPLVEVCQRELSQRASKALNLLDAGCGEGSFLMSLAGRLPGCAAVGIDLAAEGVRLAASRSKELAWCVADLAALPAPARSFSAVLNVLSPANYGEFTRVLEPGGLLLKAVPTARHLRELRGALGLAEDYSNQPVAEPFRAHFPATTSQVVEAAIPCQADIAAAFLKMTPLGWHATDAQRAAFAASPPEQITVSLEVLTATVSG